MQILPRHRQLRQEVRRRTGELPTDYTFTGQREDNAFGMLWYNARFYDPNLGRFSQPDSLIVNLFYPPALDRYQYVYSNPVNDIDPSGHETCDADGYCRGYDPGYWNWVSRNLSKAYNIIFTGDWSLDYKLDILTAAVIVGERLNNELTRLTCSEAFKAVYGLNDGDAFWFEWDENCWGCRETPEADPEFGYTHSENHIEFASMSSRSSLRRINNVIHELGHAFNRRLSRLPETAVNTNNLVTRPAGFFGLPGQFIWVQSPRLTASEIFADQLIGWIYHLWASDSFGRVRAEFMTRMDGNNGWVAQAARLP